ncbi:hypothetical protein [Plantactinospora sp. WMMB782]|uniref:hypothetical protein n=1 Tax=Plantactinospora sp. WMMB782 TaxID=3404121 RepID=UPI003B95F370
MPKLSASDTVYVTATETTNYDLELEAEEAARVLGVSLDELSKIVHDDEDWPSVTAGLTERFKELADVTNSEFELDQISEG